jgi:hypothetical protein
MKMNSLNDNIHTELQASFDPLVEKSILKALQQFMKGNNVEPNAEDPQQSHSEHTHSSHFTWGSPHSWNKVPKVDMHKFDGSNPTGWVSQMEQYFSLQNIWDDETKLHVGVLYLDQEWW